MACHNCEEVCSFCGAEHVVLAGNSDNYPPAYICAECALNIAEQFAAYYNGTLQAVLEAERKDEFYALFGLEAENGLT